MAMKTNMADAIAAAAAQLQASAAANESKNDKAAKATSKGTTTSKPRSKADVAAAIAAAAAEIGGESKTKGAKHTEAKAAPKAAAPKGRDFTGLFEGYLSQLIESHLQERAKQDAAFAKKMQAKGKSFKGCLNYIGGHFYRQAERQRKAGYVGIGGDDRELLGMAVHYYDETNEELKREEEGK